MAGITSTLDIAKQALLTHQMATQVASHNIANVDTPGYSRQTISLTTAPPSTSIVGSIGNGVRAEEITRHYDQFLNQRLVDQNSTLGNLEARQQTYQVLETIFDETGGYGLNDLMNQFWDSWQILADNPESSVARRQVVLQGQTVADHLQYMYAEITNLRTQTTGNISATVDAVNTLASDIAAINQQIINSDVRNRNANDLLDRRDQLINELAQLIDISYFELDTGSYTIALPDGHTLVEDSTSNILSWETISGTTGLYWQGGSASQVFIDNSAALGGKLGGFIEMQNQLAENDPNNYLGRLDNFANALISEINQQHAQGVGLTAFSGTVTGSEATDITQLLSTYSYGAEINTAGSFDIWTYDPAGVGAPTSVTVNLAGAADLVDVVTAINGVVPGALTASITSDNRIEIATDGTLHFAFANDTSNFLQAAGINTFFSGYDAGTISVNSAISNDPAQIAAGTVNTTNGAIYYGDNSNALGINTIRQNANVSFLDGSASTLDGYYNGLVSDIALNSKNVSWSFESSQLTLNSLNEIRDSVSGVSLDEEMANLIKYQQAYTAAAKLITITDEMMISLLNSI